MMFKFGEPYDFIPSNYWKIADRQQYDDCRLVFTRGLPRSGKSSIAKQSQIGLKYLTDIPSVVICGDSFRIATHGQTYNRLAEPHVSQSVLTAIRAFLHDGYIVIFDETNSSEWSLRRIFEIDCRAEYIDVATPISTCLENNEKTGKEIPNEVFFRVRNNLLTIDPEIIRGDYL